MNFSKTTEYALRILSYMAGDESRLYNANDIYDHLKIPFRYLRKQLTILSKSGLLVSVQGPYGGYRIAKKLDEISLLDIVQIMDEESLKEGCFFGFQNCNLINKCPMHDKWGAIREIVKDTLRSTSLADLKVKGF